jgi:hypothetical protein
MHISRLEAFEECIIHIEDEVQIALNNMRTRLQKPGYEGLSNKVHRCVTWSLLYIISQVCSISIIILPESAKASRVLSSLSSWL